MSAEAVAAAESDEPFSAQRLEPIRERVVKRLLAAMSAEAAAAAESDEQISAQRLEPIRERVVKSLITETSGCSADGEDARCDVVASLEKLLDDCVEGVAVASQTEVRVTRRKCA